MWVFKVENPSLSRSESLLVENERKMGCYCVDSVSKWEIVGVVKPDCRPWQIALREVLRWKNYEAQLQWEFGGQEVHPRWLGGEASGRVSQGLDHPVNSPSKGVLQARMGVLGVSDGGMLKCSEDHSESREEHSERQNRGASPRRSKAQQMRSSMVQPGSFAI